MKTEKLNNERRVSISPGNRKMGAIPSVSLPPVITCPKGCPCASKCYAARMCKRYPRVRNAYTCNWEIFLNDPNGYWVQVKAAAVVTRYFRYHVSGDIPTYSYFAGMVRVAEEIPGTDFLCFTKRYDIVNGYISKRSGHLPKNLHVIFSRWGDNWAVPNPYNLPESTVIFKGQEPDPDDLVCGGNCAECACRGVGCWQLQNGQTIAFYEH